MYLDLFMTFFKIGLFTFGGGYSILPMLEKEVVQNKKWATQEEIIDYFAISQCTPGAIAVNVATFIGYSKKGVLGGIIATLGVVFPSLIIILLIAIVFDQLSQYSLFQHALAGIRIGVCVLLFNSIRKLFKTGIKDLTTLTFFILSLILSLILKLPTIILVCFFAISGIFVGLNGERK